VTQAAAPKSVFINLPVTDLSRSEAFYRALGAGKNPMFSDETAACMVFSDAIYVMLLTHEKFSTFTDRAILDAQKTAQVMIALTQDNRDAVDAVLARAVAAGGLADPNPQQDYGFMYSRSSADPDGHIWELFWMDPDAAQQGPEAFAAQMGGG